MPWLSERNRMWRERAREVAEKVVRPLARKYDLEETYPWEIKEALAEAGLMGVWIPKEYGGSGGGILDLCLCVEELSRACGGVGVLYASTRSARSRSSWAAPRSRRRSACRAIASGEKLIAFCLSEKFAGSDAGGLRRARRRATATTTCIQRREEVDHQRRRRRHLHRLRASPTPTSKSRRISAFVRREGDARLHDRQDRGQDGHPLRAGASRPHFDDCRVHRAELLGGERRAWASSTPW